MFSIQLKVRDYECDMQGIVNNAVYQHYLEHARHEFLLAHGLSFAGLTAVGILLVVKRIEIDYHSPLRSGDSFEVQCGTSRISPLRFAFIQKIVRLPDGKPVVDARVIGTSINTQGRPFLPPVIDQFFGQDE
ncbi:MAG TPA: acyl-CoA thioesterase [Bacteroidales bacterium]|nr:acyl-CoA thioesterase [Bacteroidales bacterium]